MLSCDRPCALCTFVRPDCRLLLCALVRAGQVVPCEGAQGNAFGSGRAREAVSKMLSCDRTCAWLSHPYAFGVFQPRYRRVRHYRTFFFFQILKYIDYAFSNTC